MTDRPTPLSERPVLSGILALTGVAVVVGLLAGVVVLLGTSILGIGGDDEAEATGTTPSAGETLYLPDPVETEKPTGPRITLDVAPEDLSTDDEKKPEEDEEDEKKDEFVLRAGQESVTGMQRIDLAGDYPKGDGAILQVQRKENGAWTDFPVTVPVRDGQFTTYVMTGRTGAAKFRVVDTDSGRKSNVVKVTIN